MPRIIFWRYTPPLVRIKNYGSWHKFYQFLEINLLQK